jgi:hypothetical protein
MIRNIPKKFTALLRWADDRINPIVVKELRQGVQSRVISTFILLLLIALVFICVGGAMFNTDPDGQTSGGRGMFILLADSLYIAVIGLIPLYVLIRLWRERGQSNIDLQFVTTLKPIKIVRGKFYAGVALVTLLYSICLPFLLFTYLLGGFDIPSMFLSLFIGYFFALGMTSLALALAAWASTRKILGTLVMLAAIPGLIAVVILNIASTSSIVSFGTSEIFSWTGLLVTLYILTALWLAMKVVESMSVGMLSPPSSNRTRRLRVWASITIVALTLITIIASIITSVFYSSSGDFLDVFVILWLMLTTQLTLIMLIIAICEPDGYSPRVMLHSPSNPLLRVLAFPYTIGVTGGFAWVALHFILILAAMPLIHIFSESFTFIDLVDASEMSGFYAWIVYVVTYAMLGRFLLRLIPNKLSPADGWVLMLLAIAIFMLGSMSISYLLDPQFWFRGTFWKYFNPVTAISVDEIRESWVLTIFALLTIAMNLFWDLSNLLEYFTGAAPLRSSQWTPGHVVPEYAEGTDSPENILEQTEQLPGDNPFQT